MAVSRKAMTEGIRTPTFLGTLNKARFDNPSVSRLRETCEPAPFAQGSLWVLPHQCVYRYFSEESEKCTTFFYELSKIIIPHSLVRNDTVFFRPFLTTQPTAIRSIPNCFRRSGRGILKGAAVRQRPLSRLLLKVLAETRTLPPEGPVPKVFRRLKCDVKACAFCRPFYQK